MRQILEEDGDDGVRRLVSEDRTEYLDSLVKLVRQSRNDPKKLRAAVASYLKGRGGTPTYSHNPSRTVYWLGWTDATLRDAAQSMGGHRGSLSWYMAFSHHKVEMDFAFYGESGEDRSFVDRLKGFMEKTPINRQKPDEYAVRDAGYGWETVYRREILSHEVADVGRAFLDGHGPHRSGAECERRRDGQAFEGQRPRRCSSALLAGERCCAQRQSSTGDKRNSSIHDRRRPQRPSPGGSHGLAPLSLLVNTVTS